MSDSNKYITEIDIDEYQEFVETNEMTSVFHHQKWIKLLSVQYNFPIRIIAIKNNNKIVACIPFLEIKHLFSKKKLVSLPFSDYVTPLISDQKILNTLYSFFSTSLLNYYNSIEIRSFLFPFGEVIVKNSYVAHYLKLSSDFNSVYTNFYSNKKRNIRKAIKSNLVIKKYTDQKGVDLFYKLHLKTRKKYGTPTQPKSFFNKLGKEFLNKNNGFILIAYKEGLPISGAVFLYTQNIFVFKFGASDDKYLEYRPNDLIFYEAIKWCCENNFKIMDFGISSINNSGLRRFKSGWGAEEKIAPYTYFIKDGQIPQTKGGLNSFSKSIIRISPLWFNKIVGLLFYNRAG